jgi:CRISPR-associated endoribonuclease Cas6
MIVKIIFEKDGNSIPFKNQREVNGFIYNRLFDRDEEIHSSFSPYSISGLQGLVASDDKKCLVPVMEPYIQVSSASDDITNRIVAGVIKSINSKNKVLFGRRVTHIVCEDDSKVGKTYDVIKTLSPVLLIKDGRKLTCRDEGWETVLTEHCKRKLSNNGILDETFRIEFSKPENIKVKNIFVGEVFNPCTSFVATVYGKPKTRKLLYSLGIGGSTGSGFGAVEVLGRKNTAQKFTFGGV